MRLKTIKKSKQTQLFLAIQMVSSTTANPLLIPPGGGGLIYFQHIWGGGGGLTREGALI